MAADAATDWSKSYSQFLGRSAAISARTLSLYQLALERVSQGKLPPTIFQDHFAAFALSHSAEFAKRSSEVGSRFLSDLVRLGTGPSRDATWGGAAAERRDEAAPAFDPSNPGRWYEQMAEYAAEMNRRAVRDYRAQLDLVAAGEATPSEVQQETSDRMAKRLPEYLQLLTQIYFDLLNGINDLRSDYEETYFRGLLAKERADDERVTLTLSGPAGATAAASLSITNTTARQARVDHRTGDVRRADGVGPSLVPALTFAPEAFELAPNEEGTLTVSLQIDSELYDTGVEYTGALFLSGASDVPLELKLRILSTAAAKPANGQGAA